MDSQNSVLIDRRRSWETRSSMDIINRPKEELGVYEKMVYVVLCGYADRSGSAFPTVATIACGASCSTRQVFRALKILEKCGLLVRTPRYVEGKGQVGNLYALYGPEHYRSVNEIVPADRETQGYDCDSQTRPADVMDSHAPYDCGSQLYIRSIEQPQKNIKDTPTGAAPAETAPEDSDQGTDGELLPVSEAPSAMRSTAEYLLLKTGRKGLDEEELSALRTLDAHHYPARVQREIDKAVERYGRLGRPLRTLSFGYILSALQHQPSRAPGGGTPPGRKTPKVDYGLDV